MVNQTRPEPPLNLFLALSFLVATVLAGIDPAHAQLGGSPGQSAASPFTAAESGMSVEDVAVGIQGTTGDAARDDALRQEARRVAAIESGDTIDGASALLMLKRVRTIPGVVDASYVLVSEPLGTSLRLTITVGTQAPQGGVPLPKLLEDSRSMVKLILNGGLGLYSDGHAFFGWWDAFNRGSPIAPGPPAGSRVTFMDFSLEPGLGGITKLGDSHVYAYGAATALASGTWGPDIYQRNDRLYLSMEKAYAGLLWAADKEESLNLSAGRQPYTLNDGFLIHHVKGSTNVGERRAVFLGARTAHDMTGLLNVRWHDWTWKGFYLDPNEYEPLESNSRFAGGNARYDFGHGLTVDATYIENIHSDTAFTTPGGVRIPREGIWTAAAHLRWRNAFGARGLFAEGEIGMQRSDRADVSARAGYATVGYRFVEAAWQPAIVLRHAQWSGDDPSTSRYERWDPLLPAGSDEWMGGMIFSKFVANSNLRQTRVRFFAEPSKTFNFTVDWFRYRAMETNNLGANSLLGTLASKDLGEEVMFTGRWFVGKNYFVQTLASINRPGDAIRSALPGPARTWTSLQASIYWFF